MNYNESFIIHILFIIILIFTACHSTNDKQLAFTLDMTGENRHELEKSEEVL